MFLLLLQVTKAEKDGNSCNSWPLFTVKVIKEEVIVFNYTTHLEMHACFCPLTGQRLQDLGAQKNMTNDFLENIYTHEQNNGASGGGGRGNQFSTLGLAFNFHFMTFIKMKGRRKHNFHFQSLSALRIFFLHSLLLAS